MHDMKDNIIVLAILATVLIGTTVFVYIPQSTQLDKLETSMTREQERLAEESNRAAVIPDLSREVAALRNRYQGFGRRLPKQRELSEFLREISRHLDDPKLSNLSIEPKAPKREELFHANPIVVRFNASYPALAAFLDRIEQMERLTCVEKLVLDSTKSPNGENLEIELHLNIYFTES
jgi:Tfp pilus assembly protein PilO